MTGMTGVSFGGKLVAHNRNGPRLDASTPSESEGLTPTTAKESKMLNTSIAATSKLSHLSEDELIELISSRTADYAEAKRAYERAFDAFNEARSEVARRRP